MEGYGRPLGSSDIRPPERRILLPPILHVPDPGGDDGDDDDDDVDVIADAPMRRELWKNVIATAVVVAILFDWTRSGIRRCAIWANILEWVGSGVLLGSNLEPRTVLWGGGMGGRARRGGRRGSDNGTNGRLSRLFFNVTHRMHRITNHPSNNSGRYFFFHKNITSSSHNINNQQQQRIR